MHRCDALGLLAETPFITVKAALRAAPARRVLAALRAAPRAILVLDLPAQQVARLALEHLAERGERREAHRLGAAVLEHRQIGGA